MSLVRDRPRPPPPPKGPPSRSAKRPSKPAGRSSGPSAGTGSNEATPRGAGADANSLSRGSGAGAGGDAAAEPVGAAEPVQEVKYRHDREKKQIKIVGQPAPPVASRIQKPPKELAGLNTSRLKALNFGDLAPSPEHVQSSKRPAGMPTSSAMRARMMQERKRKQQAAIEQRKKKVNTVLVPVKRALALPFTPVVAVWRFLFGKGVDGDRSIRESWNALRAEQRLAVAGGLALVALIGIWVSDYLQATIPPTESEQQELQAIMANLRSRYDQLAENLSAAQGGSSGERASGAEGTAPDQAMVDSAPSS